MKTKVITFLLQSSPLNDIFDFSSIDGIVATTGIAGLGLIVLLFVFRPIIDVISNEENKEHRFKVLKMLINRTSFLVALVIVGYIVLKLFPDIIKSWDQTESKPTVIQEEKPIKVEEFCILEANSEYSFIDGEAQHEHILDYFPGSNSELFNFLERLKSRLQAELGVASVNYISAPAGYGKSYVIKNHLSETFEDFNLKSISLTDLASNPENAKYVYNKIDLNIKNLNSEERISVNTLPFIKKIFPWDKLFNIEQGKNNVIIIDDLDEIHRKSSKEILHLIDELVFAKQDSTNLVFFVLGRPTAFFDYLSWSHLKKAEFRKKFQLKRPEYRTYGDLNARVDNWLDYRRSDKKSIKSEIYNKLRNLLLKHPELSQNFELLANSGSLIDIIIDEDLSDIHLIKKRLYDAAIVRNQGSHGRPSDNEYGYYDLIQQVAIKYHDNIDSYGVFNVAEDDFVVSKDSVYKAKVSSLLDNSGLVYFDPLDSGTRSYKFYPSLLHRFLIEENNLELFGDYKLADCTW